MSALRSTRVALRLLGNVMAPGGRRGRLCIVNYHRVLEAADPFLATEPDVQTFRWQMELLAEYFTVLPLQQAVQALGTERLPPRAVAITFDDGYRSVHDLALPILRALDLPATVFVATGYVGEHNMWNDRIIDAIRRMPVAALDLRDCGLGTHDLADAGARSVAIDALTQATKYRSHAIRLALAERLEQLAGIIRTPAQMITRELLAGMAGQGIDIGAHTVTHPILAGLDEDGARREIIDSKMQLEQWTGRPVTLFAYPNGKVGCDFDARDARIAQEAGFVAAFTTETGAARPQHDRFQLPRSRPWDATPLGFGLRLLRWMAE